MIGFGIRSLAFAIALVGVSTCAASAQSMPANSAGIIVRPADKVSPNEPPVAIVGWSYEKLAADVHMFTCQDTQCVPHSRVSYRLYAPDTTTTLAQFREQQQGVVKALQERAPPGTRIEILDISGDEGAGTPRMFTTRRLISAPDGKKEFVSSSMLFGTRHSASVISSSLDEQASRTNQSLFVIGVMSFVNASAQAKP